MPPPRLAQLKLACDGDGRNFLDSLRVSETSLVLNAASARHSLHINEGGMTMGDDAHYMVSAEDVSILDRIGSGASSVVYKALRKSDGRCVAVKKINAFEKDTRRQLVNEIKALCENASGVCPHLVSFYGAFTDPASGHVSVVLEFAEGGSVADLVERAGPLPEPVLGHMLGKMLRGLAHLHDVMHTVHRDIKPENVLLTAEGSPKITDFGISTFIASMLTKCNTFLGTVPYMSPERLENAPYSYPADVWSLGIVVVEAATGRFPYSAHDGGAFELSCQVLQQPPPSVPGGSPELNNFVLRALCKDPSERPSAAQLLAHPFVVAHEGCSDAVSRFMAAHKNFFGN
ncbi:hypothetical protein FOA52_014100 [Chlamydomonas sp. UWO 241]|nr:hypothetical protein FOA52_014100 [Chlamydomonas sp. UWO 241]